MVDAVEGEVEIPGGGRHSRPGEPGAEGIGPEAMRLVGCLPGRHVVTGRRGGQCPLDGVVGGDVEPAGDQHRPGQAEPEPSGEARQSQHGGPGSGPGGGDEHPGEHPEDGIDLAQREQELLLGEVPHDPRPDTHQPGGAAPCRPPRPPRQPYHRRQREEQAGDAGGDPDVERPVVDPVGEVLAAVAALVAGADLLRECDPVPLEADPAHRMGGEHRNAHPPFVEPPPGGGVVRVEHGDGTPAQRGDRQGDGEHGDGRHPDQPGAVQPSPPARQGESGGDGQPHPGGPGLRPGGRHGAEDRPGDGGDPPGPGTHPVDRGADDDREQQGTGGAEVGRGAERASQPRGIDGEVHRGGAGQLQDGVPTGEDEGDGGSPQQELHRPVACDRLAGEEGGGEQSPRHQAEVTVGGADPGGQRVERRHAHRHPPGEEPGPGEARGAVDLERSPEGQQGECQQRQGRDEGPFDRPEHRPTAGIERRRSANHQGRQRPCRRRRSGYRERGRACHRVPFSPIGPIGRWPAAPQVGTSPRRCRSNTARVRRAMPRHPNMRRAKRAPSIERRSRSCG